MEDPTELRKSFVRAGRIAIQAQCDANRATGAPMQDREIEARKWLAELDANEAAEISAKRDSCEEKTLSLAKEANEIARDANRLAARAERWAMYAAIAAVIALIISIANKTS